MTIPATETQTPEIDLSRLFPAGRLALTVIAPTALPEGVSVHIARSVGEPYAALQKEGADVSLTAGKGVPIEINGPGAMKLVANGAVAEDREFTVLAVPMK